MKKSEKTYRTRGFERTVAPKPKKSGKRSTRIETKKDLRTK